jgi:hypothetical protein
MISHSNFDTVRIDAFVPQVINTLPQILRIVFRIYQPAFVSSVAILVIDEVSIGECVVKFERITAPTRRHPLGTRFITTSPHLIHNQIVISDETGRVVAEYIVDGCVFLAPALTAECTKFAVLAEKTLAVEIGDEGLMP